MVSFGCVTRTEIAIIFSELIARDNCGSTLCQGERAVVASDSSLAEEPSPVQIVCNIYYSGLRLILN
jgi:hypothetical protein